MSATPGGSKWLKYYAKPAGPRERKMLTDALTSPAPCDNCLFALLCKIKRRACRDFRYFVETGRNRKTYRLPTRKTYNRFFKEVHR